DYVFGQKAPAPSTAVVKAKANIVLLHGTNLALADPPPPSPIPNTGASKTTTKKTIGPLTISNIGLEYKNGMIYILVDATVALGPIIFTLIGFGIGINLSKIKLD